MIKLHESSEGFREPGLSATGPAAPTRHAFHPAKPSAKMDPNRRGPHAHRNRVRRSGSGRPLSDAESLWYDSQLDLISRIRIETAVWATGFVLWGVGLFLVFFNVARIRPATKLWTIGAAVVVLVSGVASALLRVLYFQAYSSFIEGAPITTVAPMLETINAIASAAGLAGSTATILGLFGLTRFPPSP